MGKKVTLQDLATQCNVSIATVSYVLNDIRDEHISHETRVLILDTAHKMGYVSKRAKAAKHSKTNTIGIMVHIEPSDPQSKRCIYFDLAMELQSQLQNNGYLTSISILSENAKDFGNLPKSSIDAAFIIDTSSAKVHQLTQKYYVPLIFVNCEINDSLFYRIYPNYTVIMSQAKRMLGATPGYLVMDDIRNEELADLICKDFQPENIFINGKSGNLRHFLSRMRHQKGIILGDILGLEVERLLSNEDFVVISYFGSKQLLLPDTQTVVISNHTIASSAINILERQFESEHDICPDNKLLINPDSSGN